MLHNSRMKALLVIAKHGYQDVELKGARDGLIAAGFEVVLSSTDIGECIGKYDGRETATITLSDVKVSDYDRIGFIGGPGAFALCDNTDAHRIAKETVAAKKPLGAICIAPMILAASGVLKGKRATVATPTDEQVPFFTQKGATYTGEDVTVDGLIITANGPKAAEEFGKKFARMSSK